MKKEVNSLTLERLKEIDDKRVSVISAFEKDPFLGYNSLSEAYDDYQVTSNVEVLARMLNRENIFISGVAGSGKTTIINKFIELIDAETKGNANIALTASTGISAQLIGGRTIHSWSGLGIMEEPFDKARVSPMINIRLKDIKATDTLIIDEISMLPAYFFKNLDKVLKYAKNNDLPFGGVQLIVSGDFQQLPPVNKNKDIDNSFVITTKEWTEANFKYCYLDKNHRSKDNRLRYILETISRGKVDYKTISLLRSRLNIEKDKDKNYVTLFTTNKNVDKFNEEKLEEIDSPLVSINYTGTGSKENIEKLIKNNNIPKTLNLKKGATVISTSNIIYSVPNGSIGKVVGFTKNNLPIVKFNNSTEIIVTKQSYDLEEDHIVEEEGVYQNRIPPKKVIYKKVIASVSQIPLKLGFAITIHKSQGQSFDGVVADISNCFSPGLGYVALSRVNSLDDLILTGFRESSLNIDKKAKNISNFVKLRSIKDREEFKDNEEEYESLLRYSMYRNMNWDVE